MSKLLSVQDNLIKASAKELLRTDLLHQTAAQTLSYTEHLPGSYGLVHYRNGVPPTRLHTHWKGPMKVVSGSDSRYLLYDLITDMASAGWLLVKDGDAVGRLADNLRRSAANLECLDARDGDAPLVSEGK